MLAMQLVASGLGPRNKNQGRMRFRHSHSWRKGFFRRNGLASRRFHHKRRSLVDDTIVCSFLNEYELAKQQFKFRNIYNVDETSWRIINNRLFTIANKGQDEVTCVFKEDEKACLTVIAGIARDGTKLPLWVIVSGLTECVHKKFTEDDRISKAIRYHKLVITHSPNGWSDADVARQYIAWLHERNDGEPKYLIWDIYSAHRAEEVKDFAIQNDVSLGFVPSGQTGEWQPLDYRIFGSLKQRAKERFDAAVAAALVRGEEYQPSFNDALIMLLEVWLLIDQEEILNAWQRLG